MRRIDWVATAIATLLGIGHVGFTPTFAPGWTAGAVWFAGSGLALLFLGLLNAARLLVGADRRIAWMCLAANATALLWMAFLISLLRAPQAFLALAAVMGVLAGSLASLRRPSAP